MSVELTVILMAITWQVIMVINNKDITRRIYNISQVIKHSNRVIKHFNRVINHNILNQCNKLRTHNFLPNLIQRDSNWTK